MKLLTTSLLENKKFIDINNMKIIEFIEFRYYNNKSHLVFQVFTKKTKPSKKPIFKNINIIYPLEIFNKLLNINEIICV